MKALLVFIGLLTVFGIYCEIKKEAWDKEITDFRIRCKKHLSERNANV